MKRTNLITRLQAQSLNILTNVNKKEIVIKDNPHFHPFSWFLTTANGELFKSGRISDKETTISIPDLENGIYHFRTQGEIYELNVA